MHREDRARPCPPTVASLDGILTVVVATRDRRDGAVRTVRRLAALPERPEILVVDDGSTDGTGTAIRAVSSRARVLRAGGRGAASARNLGVRRAATPFVAFADDDSWWAPGALAQAVAHLRDHPRLGLLAARILVAEGRLDPICAAMARSPLPSAGLPGPRVLGFVACGAVVRRRAFVQAGGFPHRYGTGGEEAPLAMMLAAAGWDLAYVDDVVAHHAPGEVAHDGRVRARTVARNDLWTAWRHRRGLGVVRGTLSALGGVTNVPALHGVALAVAGLPHVLAARRPVPAHVERHCRLLSASARPGGQASRSDRWEPSGPIQWR